MTTCNTIDKPLVVNRYGVLNKVVYIMAINNIYTAEMRFKSNLNYI